MNKFIVSKLLVLDAGGVPGTTGIFDGNLHAIGSYDECVGIEVKDEKICGIESPDFRGRYALATLAPVAAKPEETETAKEEFRFENFGIHLAVFRQVFTYK